jgi:hypothetical protein
MKKALDRLRCWLIRKLGGFVFPAEGTVIQVQSRHIETLTAAHAIGNADLNDAVVELPIMKNLASDLGRAMYDAGLIEFTHEEQDFLFSRIRATVRVVEPEEVHDGM